MVSFKAILLSLMIFWDASLHWVSLFNLVDSHPLYLMFPLWGIIPYELFWSIFWTFGFILSFLLIFSGIKVTTKNIINMPEQDTKRLENIEKLLDRLDKNEIKVMDINKFKETLECKK